MDRYGVLGYVRQKEAQNVPLSKAHLSQQGVGESAAKGARLPVRVGAAARTTCLQHRTQEHYDTYPVWNRSRY
jgi:hypothetical protein